MITAFIIVAALAYLFIGGAVGYRFYLWRKSACSDCKHGRFCMDMHGGLAAAVGAFWILTLPAVGGASIMQWVNARDDRAVRRENRKQADHLRKMAELREQREMTMESVKFLVENGIKADVPGLFEVDK